MNRDLRAPSIRIRHDIMRVLGHPPRSTAEEARVREVGSQLLLETIVLANHQRRTPPSARAAARVCRLVVAGDRVLSAVGGSARIRRSVQLSSHLYSGQ